MSDLFYKIIRMFFVWCLMCFLWMSNVLVFGPPARDTTVVGYPVAPLRPGLDPWHAPYPVYAGSSLPSRWDVQQKKNACYWSTGIDWAKYFVVELHAPLHPANFSPVWTFRPWKRCGPLLKDGVEGAYKLSHLHAEMSIREKKNSHPSEHLHFVLYDRKSTLHMLLKICFFISNSG